MNFMAFYSKYFTEIDSHKASLLVMETVITPLDSMNVLAKLYSKSR